MCAFLVFCLHVKCREWLCQLLIPFCFFFLILRHLKLYKEVAVLSNITVKLQEMTYDPDASWLNFHLGINRYALYSRDDPAVLQLLKDMSNLTIVNAGDTKQSGCIKLTTILFGQLKAYIFWQITLRMKKPWKELATAHKV